MEKKRLQKQQLEARLTGLRTGRPRRPAMLGGGPPDVGLEGCPVNWRQRVFQVMPVPPDSAFEDN